MKRVYIPIIALLLWVPLVTTTARADGIIGAKKSKVYHTHPDECGSAKRIGAANRLRFSSTKEAQAAGRRLCKRCAALDRKAKASRDKGKKNEGDHGGRDEPARPAGRRPPPEPKNPPPHAEAPSIPPDFVRVSDVLAGGTLVLDTGEKAALIGVVCPQPGQRHARDAVRYLREQTLRRTVRLSYEASPCFARPRDDWGRLLIYAVPEPDGRDLAGELIFQGYAWADPGVRFGRAREYARQEEAAWRAGRGVWARSDGPDGKRTVVTGRFARQYHRPDCRHVSLLTGVTKMTVNEARQRRLVPCSEYRAKMNTP